MPEVRLSPREVGTLVADLERLVGQPVDLGLLDDATPALAYRVFRDCQHQPQARGPNR